MLLNIADNRPKTKYIIAVDDSQSTLHEIIRAISMGLGPKKIKHVPKDDAMLIRDISVSNPANFNYLHHTVIIFFSNGIMISY